MNLVKKVTQEHKAYQIQDATGSAILLSKEDYDGLLETLELLSITGFRESLQVSMKQVADGETFSLDEVLGGID